MDTVNKCEQADNSLNKKKIGCKFILALLKWGHYFVKWSKISKKEYSTHFILDREKKLVYLNNPKVACTSIKKSMFGDLSDIHIYVMQYIVFKLNSEMDDYYKFTFVRNPYERLVSYYEDKCVLHSDDTCISCYPLNFLLLNKEFNQFIKNLCLIPNRLMETHFARQYELLYDKKGKCMVDFVGKIENIREEYEPIRLRFDLLPLPHSNRVSSLTGKNWMDYYTPLTATLVYWKYRKDFKTFGYENEYKKLKDYLRTRKR